MKLLFGVLLLVFSFQTFAQVKVKGYYRKDGTYVKPHYRSTPDGNPYNNWSFPGNTNPYTGKTATGDPNAYLKNYYNRESSSSNFSNVNQYYVSALSLNVRSGPSPNYKLIGSLSKYDQIRLVEGYDNGWAKIEYFYWSDDHHEFTSQVGYVASKYINKTISYDLNSILNNPAAYNFGNKSGTISFWTNCNTEKDIKIYLNEIYVGELRKVYLEGTPECGESSTLNVIKPAGVYKMKAIGGKYIWEGTVTVSEGECSLRKLAN